MSNSIVHYLNYGYRQIELTKNGVTFDILIKLTLILVSLLLVLVAILSITWRFEHDLPIMLYMAFLINQLDYVPYRDIFDMNTPGTHFAYCLIGRLSGYTNLGVRSVDLSLLATILVMNWLWMKRLGGKVAWCGSVLFGLLYLGFGPPMSLQREFLLLLPIIVGIYLYNRLENRNVTIRNLAVGFSFGIAATIKPHAAIGLLPLLTLEFLNCRQNNTGVLFTSGRFLKQSALPAAIGFAVPALGVFLYLWTKGATTHFLDIAQNYWPLYASLTGGHKTVFGMSRVEHLILNYRTLGGFGVWMASAAVASYLSLYDSELTDSQKRQVILLIMLTFCYSIYPVFAGQFWGYHWLLFLYFVVQLSSICLIARPKNTMTSKRLLPVIVLAFVVCAMLPLSFFKVVLLRRELSPPKHGRVDEIVSYLIKAVQPGDTVQPLDWVGGAIHAMLMAQAKIATPFVYDFHFYHHISNDYIQRLREEFILDMDTLKPRHIIQVVAPNKPWVTGVDTTREFKELQSLLDNNYQIAFQGDGFVIHELRRVHAADDTGWAKDDALRKNCFGHRRAKHSLVPRFSQSLTLTTPRGPNRAARNYPALLGSDRVVSSN